MKSFILALVMAGTLSACAFMPPKAPAPPDSPRVPINATAPQPGALR